MLVAPETPALRRWGRWSVAILIAEAGWFALVRPRVSGNTRGLLALAMVPVTVIGYLYLMAAVCVALDRRDWDYRFRQLIVIMLGLSVGWFVFALNWLVRVHTEGELG